MKSNPQKLFSLFDPPPYGWTRFNAKQKLRQKRKKQIAFSLAPLMLLVLGIYFQITSESSQFLKQAKASDILFQGALLNANDPIKLTHNNQSKTAQIIYQSQSTVIYKIDSL